MAVLQPRFAVGAHTALTTTRAVIVLQDVVAADQFAFKVNPRLALLQRMRWKIDTIVGAASRLIWNLTLDAAGDVGISYEYDQTIVRGVTAAKGHLNLWFDFPIDEVRTEDLMADRLHVVVRTNAGTCSASPYLYFDQPQRGEAG